MPVFDLDPGRERVYGHVLAALKGLPLISGGEPDDNRAQARNRLARSAAQTTADVYVFVDADSLVPRNNLLEAARLAGETPGLVFAFDVYQRLSRASTSRLNHWQEAFSLPVEWEMYDSPSMGATAISRACFDELGGFDESFDACEDVDFSQRAARLWPVRRLPGELVHLWHPRPAVEPQNHPHASRLQRA